MRAMLFANAAAGMPCCSATLITTEASSRIAAIPEPSLAPNKEDLLRRSGLPETDAGRDRHVADDDRLGDGSAAIGQAPAVGWRSCFTVHSVLARAHALCARSRYLMRGI
jgi:hypothetical protein